MGATSFEDFYSKDFENFVLDKGNTYLFDSALKEDANDLFYKGILSLTEGLNGFSNKQYSWAVVKCYYSVFYFLKTELALKDIGLIRHKSLYYLEAKEGAKPITKGRSGANRKNYSADHKATINYFKDLFSSDILLTQNIEGLNSYEWLMKKREQINYQEKHFNEPSFPYFLLFINTEIEKGNFNSLIKEIIGDVYVKTFQPEYATLAIPIKRAILTNDTFIKSGHKLNIDIAKLDFLKSITKFEIFA